RRPRLRRPTPLPPGRGSRRSGRFIRSPHTLQPTRSPGTHRRRRRGRGPDRLQLRNLGFSEFEHLTACSSGTSGSASSSSGSVTEIPDETAGPYPADGSNGPDILEQSGIVRSDIRSNIDGSDTVDG